MVAGSHTPDINSQGDNAKRAAFENKLLKRTGLKVFLNFCLVVASAVIFCLSAWTSFWLVYQSWSEVIKDMLSHEEFGTDPLVLAFILIAANGCLEVVYVVVWLWIGGPLWLSGNRTRPSCIRSLTLLLTFQVAAVSLVLQVVTTLYIVYINFRFPNLHQEQEKVMVKTLTNQKSWLPFAKHEEPQQQGLEEDDILVGPMTIFKRIQPVILTLFSLSCFLKTVFLKHYEKLKKAPPANQFRDILQAHSIVELDNNNLPEKSLQNGTGMTAPDSRCEETYKGFRGMETIPEESDGYEDVSVSNEPQEGAVCDQFHETQAIRGELHMRGDTAYSGFHDIDDFSSKQTSSNDIDNLNGHLLHGQA